MPNPSSGHSVGLNLQGIKPGIYQVRLLNAQGQVVHNQLLVHAGGNSVQSLTPRSELPSGNYVLELSDSGKRQASLPFVVSSH
jgi:hypothetical protein